MNDTKGGGQTSIPPNNQGTSPEQVPVGDIGAQIGKVTAEWIKNRKDAAALIIIIFVSVSVATSIDADKHPILSYITLTICGVTSAAFAAIEIYVFSKRRLREANKDQKETDAET